MRRLVLAVPLLGLVAAGCGGGGGGNGGLSVTIAPAKTYQLAGFTPAGPITPGKPTKVSFRIQLPSGKTLTAYARGAGPHTGVHFIAVRDDLSTMIHQHPPVGADGQLTTTVTFPTPGRWHLVIDAYPKVSGTIPRNFQLTKDVTVSGTPRNVPLGTPPLVQKVDGYTVRLQKPPKIHLAQGATLHFDITDPKGRPAKLTPWFGATAHAVFFQAKTLAYFHTHVCAPDLKACLQSIGGIPVGHSDKPGVLRVGLVMPATGTWRLFLQAKASGRVLTIPYTLKVTS
jgi:hypothetical protein